MPKKKEHFRIVDKMYFKIKRTPIVNSDWTQCPESVIHVLVIVRILSKNSL